MSKIDYRKIYETNQDEWKALTREPEKYEALLAGHYSDSNHFVYELLQNAEDEKATKVVIEYYKDQLVFYHNGEPFDEDDVRGVSSMLMGTKDRDDAQTIGRFGMGFKSVFKYTYQPEIYSDDEAFVIKNYLLPVKNDDNWNYLAVKDTLVYPDGDNTKYYPFASCKHLTKIVIPFKKRNENGGLIAVSGKDVLEKLNSLTGEILLFLTYIRNLYWINKETGRHVHISMGHAAEDEQLLTCRITGSNKHGKEEISRFLKYKRIFDHPKMRSAEVSVAYKLNAVARNINEMNHTPVWVYFPTRDMTELPFLIHGSFETAVSREKLMTPSAFNNSLFEQLGDLISDSMVDLARRNLITQPFLRRVVLAAFQDEMKNDTILGLKEKITKKISEENILPDRDGNYRNKDELTIAVPFQIADQKESTLWKESFSSVKHFVAFNNERERNFTEYFSWLRDDLGIRVFNLSDWAKELNRMRVQRVTLTETTKGELKNFYGLLSDYRESLYSSNLTYTRGGPYELAIRNCLSRAWDYLRKAPIVLNAENDLVPAFEGEVLSTYLNTSSRYRTLRPGSIVSPFISKEFESLLKDGFRIAEFDNYQFVKEKVIEKYILKNDYSIHLDDEERHEKEYIEDIQQILDLIEEYGNTSEVIKLLKDAYIIKVVESDDSRRFARPQTVYVDSSEEGINMAIYYAPIYEILAEYYDEETYELLVEDGNRYDFGLYQIDKSFYDKYNISISKLKKLGLVNSPVLEGTRADYSGKGDRYWRALGEYCPNIEIDGLEKNLKYIQHHPQASLAKKKSVEILKLFLSIKGKLCGHIRKRKINPYDSYEKAWIIKRLNYYRWLFDNNGKLKYPGIMSRYDLNEEIYRNLPSDKEAFSILGFVEKEADEKADTFERVEALDRRDKTIMFRQLAKELGYDISDINSSDRSDEDEGESFDPNVWQSEDFPQRRIRNMESLMEHVRQEFFCADPVKYQKVLRQIRTSKSPGTIRAYSLGMYVNESNTQICQMCKKAAPYVDVTEIANYGIEMPQLNLCLCRNCSSRYKQFRDGDKAKFKKEITKAFRNLDISIPAEDYEISLSPTVSIHFTQTHLAEVKEIITLLDKYGVPGDSEDVKNENTEGERNVGPLDHPQITRNRLSNGEKRSSGISDPQIGERVRHKRLGVGIIVAIEGPLVGIKFNADAIKKFLWLDGVKTGLLTVI